MSDHRKPPLPPSFTGPRVKGICRWCGKPVTEKGRQYWHKVCLDIFHVAWSSASQRYHVWKRDRGICARCKKDTLAGFEKGSWLWLGTGRLWQADHIKPLIEAKGDITYWLMSNLQTLCTKCHLIKGAEDRARRKALTKETFQAAAETLRNQPAKPLTALRMKADGTGVEPVELWS